MNYLNIFTNFFVSFPFFFVWLSTIFLWGFIEIYNISSHFFNSKHSYLNFLNRENLSIILLFLNLKKLNTYTFLKIFFLKFN